MTYKLVKLSNRSLGVYNLDLLTVFATNLDRWVTPDVIASTGW